MKTLLFAMALAAVGCKDKSAEQPPPPAPAPPPPVAPRRPPPDAAPDAPPAIPNEQPVVVAGVPKVCSDYEAAITRLQTCTKLDVATRAKYRHAYVAAANTWTTMSDADKAKLTKTCKDGLAEITSVAKKPCGW